MALGEDAHADVLALITALRRAGVRADMAFGAAAGLKGAMKAADRSGARFAVLIGAEERRNATVRIKDLKDGDQQDVAAAEAARLADQHTGGRRSGMIRTHEAGTLRGEHAGEQVVLAGWVARRRDHGGVVFIDLRDASGVVQVVWRSDDAAAHDLRAEFCVKVTGEVRPRPAGNENPELPTGAIEVVAEEVEVLSEADPLPFPVEGSTDISEDVRIKYRYLDIRREETARALRVRSTAAYLLSDVMRDHGFVNVETPYLTRSTPEGARDFLVPVRLRPGNWYALPQSPQLFKQLLMVGGLERYYQLARCFRDEDFRKDRQPEFTQIDLEMSFVTREDVIDVGEAIVSTLWREIAGYEIPLPLPRMTYADAMARYGSDKPDLRFGLELTDLTSYFAGTEFRVFQAPYVGAVVMPGGASQTRSELDAWQDWAKSRGARGLAYALIGEDGSISGPVGKNISESERAGLAAAVNASPGDAVFFAAGAARRLAGTPRRGPPGDRQPLRPHRHRRVVVPLGGRRPDVRGDRRGRLDRGAPPVHLPAARMGRQVHHRAGRRPRRRLRHGVQRLRDRRRLDPHPQAADAAAGLRRHRPVTRKRRSPSSASSSTPSSTARRRTAAWPSAGTG